MKVGEVLVLKWHPLDKPIPKGWEPAKEKLTHHNRWAILLTRTSKMTRVSNHGGKKYGRWTVLHRADDFVCPSGRRVVAWKCVCDCGNEGIVRGVHLSTGRSKSCGCLHIEMARARAKHGNARRGGLTREYKAWIGAKNRCLNKNDEAFKHYGGRGIAMHPEWIESFAAFLEHIGPCPKRHTLDRIDVNKGYCPGNVRWATYKQQANNTRRNVFLEHDGRRQTMCAWADELSIDRNKFRHMAKVERLSVAQILERKPPQIRTWDEQ